MTHTRLLYQAPPQLASAPNALEGIFSDIRHARSRGDSSIIDSNNVPTGLSISTISIAVSPWRHEHRRAPWESSLAEFK